MLGNINFYRKKGLSILIGRQIKEARKKKGISQKELAKTLNYSQTTISKLEAGKIDLTVGNLYALATALGCGKDFLQIATDIETLPPVARQLVCSSASHPTRRQ
jgi:transcriptional regulator with XRE-family HTH domain